MFGATWDPLKNIYWKQNYSFAIDEKCISQAYQVHWQGTEMGGCNYQFSLCQKIEYHRETGREWMSVAWRGGSDISTPTVCHSVLTMMYGCYMAPVTQQNQSILPCRGMLQRHNVRLWPLLWNDKTPRGWGEKEWGLNGEAGFFIQYYKVSSPVVALERLNIAKISLQRLRKLHLNPSLRSPPTSRQRQAFHVLHKQNFENKN